MTPPDWDTIALDQPTIITVPDQLPDRADPLVVAAAGAVAARRAGGHDHAAVALQRLAEAGVVAIRTAAVTLEVRETLHSWTLVGAYHELNPAHLAARAVRRAQQLATLRRAPNPASPAPGDIAPGGIR